MRVAIVHDWLYVLGGAEKVLSALLRCYPDADVFSLFDILSPEDRAHAGLPKSRTSFLQRMPAIAKRHRSYLPLMPLAIEQLDVSAYDLVISSSYAVAKGILTGPDQLHISYVHSPMRYAWDLQHQYLREAGLTRGLKGALARYMLHKMRLWDTRTASGVDVFIANSHFIARRIRKAYGRSADVIYPPVDVAAVLPPPAPADGRPPFYFVASRLVAYKNVQAIVEAFKQMPDKTLIVAGSGPELARLKAIGASNVEFVGRVSDTKLRSLMRQAKAFVFAAEEDFGIIPVEVQSEGTPVIALGRGGLRETVVTSGPAPTGIFFDTTRPEAIAAAVAEFERNADRFTRSACHANALRFSTSRFEQQIKTFVEQKFAAFQDQVDLGVRQAIAAQRGDGRSGFKPINSDAGGSEVGFRQPNGHNIVKSAWPADAYRPAQTGAGAGSPRQAKHLHHDENTELS